MSETNFMPRIGTGPFTKALVLENPDLTLDDHLRALGIEPHRVEVAPDEDGLVRLLEQQPYDLIFKRSQVQITARVLDAAPQLFGVMLCCIGDDSVDKVACAERGVLVTNDPVSNGRSVVELVIGEMIALSRRLFSATAETNTNVFNKSQERRFEILGKTLGIFGLGRIGKQVGQVAQALGMRVAFYDNREVATEVGEAMGWTVAPNLRELFRMSDYVTAHISASDYHGRSNDHILTYDHFAAMAEKTHPSPRIFINLARGSIHAAEDLIRAVDDGHVQAAMVDVYPEEPKNKSDLWQNPYANHPRIFGTPHIGAATLEAQPRIAKHVAQTTGLLSRFGTLRNCVFGPKHVIGFEERESVTNIMTIVHSDKRGTKKAIDDAIFNAGASNLVSEHRDFHDYGIAYEVVALDKPLTETQLQGLVEEARALTNDPRAIRSIRQIRLEH